MPENVFVSDNILNVLFRLLSILAKFYSWNTMVTRRLPNLFSMSFFWKRCCFFLGIRLTSLRMINYKHAIIMAFRLVKFQFKILNVKSNSVD